LDFCLSFTNRSLNLSESSGAGESKNWLQGDAPSSKKLEGDDEEEEAAPISVYAHAFDFFPD
jgi:hypothetical protein